MVSAVTTTIIGTMIGMAIPNEARDGVWIAKAYFLVRAFIYFLGLGAIAWGCFVLPLFRQQEPINQITSQLLRGETFKVRPLLDEARRAAESEQSTLCNPTELHNEIVVRLVILNESVAANRQVIADPAYSPLYEATQKALACAPADPFAWLTLFWLDVDKHGLRPGNVNYLRLSYALGPNEGWISLWRSRLALAVFEQLPGDLADNAIDEFSKLVNTGQLYQQTSTIFADAPRAAQNRIIEHLKTANPVSRQLFAKALYDRGLNVEHSPLPIIARRGRGGNERSRHASPSRSKGHD